MKILITAALAALLAAPSALAAPRRSQRKPPPRPIAPAFKSVAVTPAAVTLDGAEAEQQILITGTRASGGVVDLTPQAVLASGSTRVVRAEKGGLLRGVGDGKTQLTVTAGGRTVRVPVVARGSKAQRLLSFRRDVMPVLGKSGCNQAACHAKQGGKNGFALSVLAFDPEADFESVARQADARRVNRIEPEKSLLLTKATMSVPHGGGPRFKVGSPEYRLLARWIAEGARWGDPGEPVLERVEVEPRERVMTPLGRQQLQVTACYSDGSRRDVTRLAEFKSNEEGVAEMEGAVLKTTDSAGEAAIMVRYMSQVTVTRVTVPMNKGVPPSAYASLPRANFIDELVYRKLAQLNLLPSAPCDDATFLRRVSLDLIGTLPTAGEARAFLTDCESERKGTGVAPQARQKLVESLLSRPEYADYWGMRWSNLLLVNPDLLLPRGAFAFDRWLRDSFQANMPYDRFVREIVTASGETHREGPPNFFRALSKPKDAGRSVSQLFLGVRMDCAECHHHPFERWGQDDFYSMAAFFARVKQKGTYPEGYHSVIYAGESGEVQHPKTDQMMPLRPLGASEPLAVAPDEDRREALVRWMTAPENPFFAKAIVNRMWGLLMSRGIVESIDDFRMTNPASNEPLLDALAKDFIAHKYDLKHLLRTITLSATYQRSSAATPNNARDTRNYSRYYTRRLPGEVLLDAVGLVTAVPQDFRGHPQGTRAIQMWDSRLQVEFLEIFGRPVRQSVCECERMADSSVGQALHLMNSEAVHRRLTSSAGTVDALDKSGRAEAEVVMELYLTAYSRFPTAEEQQAALAAFKREKTTRRQAIEDVLWALMNSAEFVLNH
jgi:hypothetical protein